MPNRLSQETSPYLLQHANNPVDWYPWCEEALEKARAEDKPILLSIGYSACHWCHVMERESFEDEETAREMNQGFINIKVDREERPDLDSIYMRAVQASVGRGGWPLTAFLTPDGRFFFGGTYFPPEPRHGMPAFRQVLAATLDAFRNRRPEVEEGSTRLLNLLEADTSQRGVNKEERGSLTQERSRDLLESSTRFLARQFDPVHGGFGPAPKFPQPVTLEFLLQHSYHTGNQESLDMVLTTLRAMARGGLRDHLGGGFHRYSVDNRWLVPHFEKMLYDNGLLARIYLQAYLISGDPELEEVVRSTLDYMLTDLWDPEGGFYSSRDADSEGEEGLFYLWSPEEILGVLGPEEGAIFNRSYNVTEGGNFEGRTILHLPSGLGTVAEAEGIGEPELASLLERGRERLLKARAEREHPSRDEKVLVGWNSFVLRSLAEAGPALRQPRYLDAAKKNATFLIQSMLHHGRLRRSWKNGKSRIPAFLEDYAGLANALLSLYESTLDPRWLHSTKELVELVIDLFWDDDQGLFFDSPRDGETLVIRPREVMDNATPSGSSLAVELLLRASVIYGMEGYGQIAERTLLRETENVARYPSAFGRLLCGFSRHASSPLEIVILGKSQKELGAFLAEAHGRYLPTKIVAGGNPERLPPLPLLEGRAPETEGAVAYVCRDFTCSPPVTTAKGLASLLAEPAQNSFHGLPGEADEQGD